MARRRRRSQEERAAEAVLHMLRTRGGAQTLLILLVVGAILFGVWYWQKHHRPAAPPTTQTPAPTATTAPLRVATWNLRKFSERAAPDLVAISKIIKENDFHLLAIQEVQTQGQAVERLRRQLGEPWRHTVSARTGNNERYAFLYRSDRVELLGEPKLIEGPTAPVFDRVPYAGTFRAGAFDFTLLTVHLSYTDTARRRREAEALARFAKDLSAHAPEKDVIVLGDFNEQGKGNLHFFDSQGWVRLNYEATNLGTTEYVYDNILVDPKFTREHAGRVGVVRFDVNYGGDTKRAVDDVSDHRPVYADFATTADDD